MSEVVVYVRPGCPFCTMLRTALRRRGLDWREVDIWEEPDAAAMVRAAADGNETVPTVNVGETWLVNPSLADVLAALRREAPDLVPPEPTGLWAGSVCAADPGDFRGSPVDAPARLAHSTTMTTPADPDAWQRNYEAKLAAVEERNNRMSQELEQIQATEHSRDGQISVTVNNQGALVGLELGDALRQRNGAIVAAEVLRLVQSAQQQIRDTVERTMQPYLGGTEAMDYVVGKVRAAEPPETDGFSRPYGDPQQGRPGVGDLGEQDPRDMGTPPSRPPRRPRDEDDDFGNGPIMG